MNRDESFDILKGILIILVIVGHTSLPGVLEHIIYWFHVPCFFMISGALQNWSTPVKTYLSKRFYSYVLPYFIWSILLFIIFLPESPLKYLVRILYGGTLNSLCFSYPFWFINALFISSVICRLLLYLFGRLNMRWGGQILMVVLAILFLWARYTMGLTEGWALPWSIELIPFILIYFAEGVISVSVIHRFYKNRVILYTVSSFVCALLILLQVHGLINYELNVKSNIFQSCIADILVPLFFFFSFKGLSVCLTRLRLISKVLITIGKSTLPILFTHAAILEVCTRLGINSILQILLAIIVGLSCTILFQNNRFLSKAFLGR